MSAFNAGCPGSDVFPDGAERDKPEAEEAPRLRRMQGGQARRAAEEWHDRKRTSAGYQRTEPRTLDLIFTPAARAELHARYEILEVAADAVAALDPAVLKNVRYIIGQPPLDMRRLTP